MATEVAKNKSAAAITTISKRGKPSAPGPASAFVAAMGTETVHYMAQCDENDPKAVECLMDWLPPVLQTKKPDPASPEGEADLAEFVEKLKKEMGTMGQPQLKVALQMAKDIKTAILRKQRQLKAQLQQVNCAPGDRAGLQETQLTMQEKEAAVLELIADISAKLNAKDTAAEHSAPGVDQLLQRLERELALQKVR